MLKRFSNNKLTRYPHMSAEEGIIWGRFLTTYGKDYKRFDYDLRIGKGLTPEEDLPQIYKQDYADLTKKRVDAVGYNNHDATIFEVKQRATITAIGQILAYTDLFKQSYQQYSVKEKIIVCERVLPEDRQQIEKQGIILLVLA